MASLKLKEVFCIIYSGLLFISGLILIGFAPYLLFKLFYHYTFISSGSVGPFFVIFFLGISHLFLTWLGIKGPQREHNFHIILFIVFALVLLLCEFATGVWSIVLWDKVDLESVELMTTSFDEFTTLNYYKKDWNKLQKQLHCCGLKGKEDYINKQLDLPVSCFLNIDDVNSTTAVIFSDGCKVPLIKYAKKVLIDGAIIGFCCAIFQAFGIFAFYSYFKTLRNERAERMARRIAAQRELAALGPDQTQIQQRLPLGSTPASTSNGESRKNSAKKKNGKKEGSKEGESPVKAGDAAAGNESQPEAPSPPASAPSKGS